MLQCKYSSSLLLLTQIEISICGLVVFEFIARTKRIETIRVDVKAAYATAAFFLSVSQHAFCKYLVLFLFQSTSVTFYRVHAIVEKQKEEMRAK